MYIISEEQMAAVAVHVLYEFNFTYCHSANWMYCINSVYTKYYKSSTVLW